MSFVCLQHWACYMLACFMMVCALCDYSIDLHLRGKHFMCCGNLAFRVGVTWLSSVELAVMCLILPRHIRWFNTAWGVKQLARRVRHTIASMKLPCTERASGAGKEDMLKHCNSLIIFGIIVFHPWSVFAANMRSPVVTHTCTITDYHGQRPFSRALSLAPRDILRGLHVWLYCRCCLVGPTCHVPVNPCRWPAQPVLLSLEIWSLFCVLAGIFTKLQAWLCYHAIRIVTVMLVELNIVPKAGASSLSLLKAFSHQKVTVWGSIV